MHIGHSAAAGNRGLQKKLFRCTAITTVTDANFYKTPADGYKALVGCYDGLQIIWSGGVSLPVAANVLSDDCFGGTGNSDGYGYQLLDEFDKSRSPSDQNIFGQNWSLYYKAIYRCNVFLSKINQIDWGSNTDLKKTYEGETRYIRAYLYFDMMRLWGHIPLLTEPSAENLPQSDPDAVYKVIASDLKFAAANIPAVPYAAQNVANRGRVTKYAAEALLARVFLFYTGYYTKSDLVGVADKAAVLTGLEDVINTGGYNLIDKYANLWPAASQDAYVGEDNMETIFAIKYTYTSDYSGNIDGNYWMVMLGMREQSIFPYGNGWGGATVNPKLWNTFDANDTRKVASVISIPDEKLNFPIKVNSVNILGTM
ncbi:RagB/SusD family nutrient uptake outer membrane protein [Pedobacter sp. NJ-S-72]